tara:strand:- start:752 stop:2065 length:1314 start_codon:yes stop_codon:yes gene_type:complete
MFFVLLGIALAFKVVYQVQAPPKPVDVNTAEIQNLQEIELITQASKDSGIETLSGSITMAGRPYLYSVLGDETKFIYEPWIDSNTVMSAVDSYDVTWRLLADEFGVDKIPFEVHLLFPAQLTGFVNEGGFSDPEILAGLSSHFFTDGQVSEAKIYVDVTDDSLFRNVPHELTHPATPNLPTWLSEGVAEYVAARVQTEIDPNSAKLHELESRGLVRSAIKLDSVISMRDLQDLDWKNTKNKRQLELAYAQSWHLVEYMIKTYSRDSLTKLVKDFQFDELDDETLFIQILGETPDQIWLQFTKDILQSLNPEELEGDVFCKVAYFGNEAGLISRDWNVFLNQSENLGSNVDSLLNELERYKNRWQKLEQEVIVHSPEISNSLYFRIERYFQQMVAVMDFYISNDFLRGDIMLQQANLEYKDINYNLAREFTDRRWLKC